MSNKIVPLIPKHTCYVEPFAGGAAIYFAKPVPAVTNADHYREVLNDKDGRITNFYRVLKTRPDELIAALEATLFSWAEYQESRTDEGDELERARRWFVNIQQSYANEAGAGWRFSKAAAGQVDPKTYVQKIERLQACADRIRQTYIEHDDAIEIIRRWDSPQTFFYVDPPYVGTDQGHYGGYTQEHLDALIAALDVCKGSFLLSGYENASYPAHWQRWEFASNSGAAGGRNGSGKGARTEIVVGRGASALPDAKAIKVMQSPAFDCFTGAL